MSDFEIWMEQTFVLHDPTIDRRPKLVIGKVEHPHALTARQTARLVCYLTTWLGDLEIKELFPEKITELFSEEQTDDDVR